MDDPFAFLTAGIKFNKQRFSKEVSTFQKKDSSQQQLQPQQQQQQQQQQLPGTAPTTSQPSKKRKASSLAPSQPGREAAPSISVFRTKPKALREAAAPETGEGDEEAEEEEQQQQQQQQQQHNARLRSGSEAGPSGGTGVYWPGLVAGCGGVVDPGCPVATTGDTLEAANVVRKHYRIKVSGPEPSPPLRSWQDLWHCMSSLRSSSSSSSSSSQSVHDATGAADSGPEGAVSGGSGGGGGKAVDWLLQNLQAKGYVQPTPIQRQAISTLLASRELLAVAPTGSGKTVAFCAPVLLHLKALRTRARKATQQAQLAQEQAQQQVQQQVQQSTQAGTPGKAGRQPGSIKKQKRGAEAALVAAAEAAAAAKEMWPDAVKAVILSPSHELTAQQGRVLKQLLPGSNLKASILTRATAAGTDFSKVDILLANPLRLATLADEGKINLSHVRFLVLDEADKLFQMGFMEQIDAVLAACTHPSIVRALFSATLPEKVEHLARTVLVEPLRVTVGVRNTAVSSVDQRLLFVGRENGKLLALRQLLAEGLKPPVLVFVATKERARALHKELMYDGVRVDSLSASQSMAARTAAIDNFRSGRTWVLVSTDLIGRGMDFVGVNTVINYDMPTTTTDYIHRIGRTGRAGHTGTAVTFFTEEDKLVLRPIANLIRESGGDVPDWMTKMKKVRTKDRKKMRLSEKVASGDTISTISGFDKKKQANKQAMIAASKAKKASAQKQA